MITKLKLMNFQGHKKSVLKFHPGLNFIIGSSDSGKSSIHRAFNWIINNKPSGNSFMSWWGGTTKAVIEVKNEQDYEYEIKRTKSSVKNEYTYKGIGLLATEYTFKAFGQNVPEKITSILNINDVNLEHQHDSHFLLFKSPGEITKIFNRIVKLDIIDTSLFNVNKELRKSNSETTRLELNLQEATEEKKKYKWLKEVKPELDAVTKLENKKEILQDKCQDILELIEDIKEYTCKIKEHNKIVICESVVKDALELDTKRTLQLDYGLGLKENIYKIYEIKKNLDYWSAFLEYEKEYKVCTKLYDKQREVFLKTEELYSDITVLFNTVKCISDISSQLEIDESKFKELMPEICPLCKGEIE